MLGQRPKIAKIAKILTIAHHQKVSAMSESEENSNAVSMSGSEENPSEEIGIVPEVAQVPQVPPWTRTKNLSEVKQNAIFRKLLENKVGDKLKHGAIPEVARQFSVSRVTVYKIWNKIKAAVDGEAVDLSSKKKGFHKKKDHNIEEKLLDVPLNKQGTIWSTSRHIGVPKSTLHRYFKCGEGRVHTNAVKPFLTKGNKVTRKDFCASHINRETNLFQDMYDCIHIDEKWFYLTNLSRRFYLGKDEEIPVRRVKSKRFVVKVMFLAAVARP